MSDQEFVCPECDGTDISVNLLATVTLREGGGITVQRDNVAVDKYAEATCERCAHQAPLDDFIARPQIKRIVFALECENAAFEDDLLGAVQQAFAEAAKMATQAIDCEKKLTFVRDINGNQCGRIDIITE